MPNPTGNANSSTRRRSGGGASFVDDDDDAATLNSSITSSSHNNRSIYMGVSADSVHSPPGGALPDMAAGTPMFLGATQRFLLAGSAPFAISAPDPSMLAISPPDDASSQTDVVAAFLAAHTHRVSPGSLTGADAAALQHREESASTVGGTTPPSATSQRTSSPGAKPRTTILVPSSTPQQQQQGRGAGDGNINTPRGSKKRTPPTEAVAAGVVAEAMAAELPPSIAASSRHNAPPGAATEHVTRQEMRSPRGGPLPSAFPPTPVVSYAPVAVAAVRPDDGTGGPTGSGVVTDGGGGAPYPAMQPPHHARYASTDTKALPTPPLTEIHMRSVKSDEMIGLDFRAAGNASPSATAGRFGSGAASPTSQHGPTATLRGQSPSRRLITAGSASNRGGGRTTPQHTTTATTTTDGIGGGNPMRRPPPSAATPLDERSNRFVRQDSGNGNAKASPLQTQYGSGGAGAGPLWRSSSPAQGGTSSPAPGFDGGRGGLEQQQQLPNGNNHGTPKLQQHGFTNHPAARRTTTPLTNSEATSPAQAPMQVMSPYHEYLRKQGLRRQDDGSHSYPAAHPSRPPNNNNVGGMGAGAAGDSNGGGPVGVGRRKPSPHGSPYGPEDLAVAPTLRGGVGDGGGLPRRRSVDDLKELTDPLAWRSSSPGLGGSALRSANETPSKWSTEQRNHNHQESSPNKHQPPTHHSRGPSGNLSAVPNDSPQPTPGGTGGGKKNERPLKDRRASERRKAAAVDEDEMLEKQRRNAATTSALHSIPWLQRQVETSTGFGGDKCVVCTAPKFWVRVDWTLRATFLAVLPATILSLDPSTTGYFSQPSTVASFAFWITAPTFGAGLREFAIVLKGSLISVVLLWIVITINPVNHVLFVILYFLQILLLALMAESVKKTGAWCISASMIQFYMAPEQTGYAYARDFFVSVAIGGLMGLGAFLIPRINWADTLATGSLTTYGSAVSIILQGVVSSYWSKTEMEREFCLIRIRQLIEVTQECRATLAIRLSEAQYEPHTADRLDRIQRRSTFLDEMTRIVSCVLQLVENIAAKPEICQSPLLKPFGERLAEPLGVLVSAMDNTVLKICDMKHPVTLGDIMLFQRVREDFQEHVSRIREELILNNDDYYTDEPDIFLGAFLFCIDELGETIESFREPVSGKSRLLEWAMSPSEDVRSGYYALQYFLKVLLTEGTLIRRAKEAIKLALSMTIPVMIQVFLLDPQDATPVAGPALIAFVYQRTGAESFQYASNRVLGTVIGSLTALISVQVADGRLWLMYIFLGMLSLVGNFVQSSVPYNAAGNAVVFSVISIISQYSDADAAMGRIQQNVFAILIYFIIAYTLWPVRAGEKLTLELDSAIRSYRETIYKLLGNMDSSLEDVQDAILGAEEHWKDFSKRIQSQGSLIPAALREPTLIGAAFPEQPWLRLIQSQQTLAHLAWMMRYAFSTFESNQADAPGDRSLHWVVVKHIAPEARECAEMIFAACDLYLLALSHSEMVPIQHLVRLRISMVSIYRRMMKTYADALVIRLDDDKHVTDERDATSPSREPAKELAQHQEGSHAAAPRGISRDGRGQLQASPAQNSGNPSMHHVPAQSMPVRDPRPPAFPDTPDQMLSSTLGILNRLAAESDKTIGAQDGDPLLRPTPRLSPAQQGASGVEAVAGAQPPPISLPANTHKKTDSPVLSSGILDEVRDLNFSQTVDSYNNSTGRLGGGAVGNAPAAATTAANRDAMRSGTPSEASCTNYVLRNRDIHSIEAFLFGIRASVMEIDEFQKALLAVQHAGYLGTKL